MVKPPTFDSNGMKKGAWSKEEDDKLKAYVQQFGHANWRLLPSLAGLARCGKSCRLRWVNYLKPGLKRGKFTKHEEDLIIKLHHLLGNKWSTIATKLPGRTDNEIKNYWHSRIKKVGRGGSNATRAPNLKEEEEEEEEDEESSSSGLINSCVTIDHQAKNPKNIDPRDSIEDLYSFARAEDNHSADSSHETCFGQLNVDFPPLFSEEELHDFEFFGELQNDSSNSLDDGSNICSPSSAEFRQNLWFESLGEDVLDVVLW